MPPSQHLVEAISYSFIPSVSLMSGRSTLATRPGMSMVTAGLRYKLSQQPSNTRTRRFLSTTPLHRPLTTQKPGLPSRVPANQPSNYPFDYTRALWTYPRYFTIYKSNADLTLATNLGRELRLDSNPSSQIRSTKMSRKQSRNDTIGRYCVPILYAVFITFTTGNAVVMGKAIEDLENKTQVSPRPYESSKKDTAVSATNSDCEADSEAVQAELDALRAELRQTRFMPVLVHP
ncbi:hypothetical protein EK21DRAFT_113656 [Setomelanomma holmii]|uniref:Uncharacterized protein n=1 Tax=Setomelanomma holmii TaxID=210430 RepID=A0A9P4H830_9PLEO|nr:hypothetical protein EK21DRAFT_113656 [Setomelanomma holmii]